MLIRSQDKKSIINLNSIDTICAKRDEESNKGIKEHYQTTIEYYNGGEESMGTLGEYSAEEKAIKVLDIIQEEYLYCERCKARGEEAGCIPSYVFQMPQDSEV